MYFLNHVLYIFLLLFIQTYYIYLYRKTSILSVIIFFIISYYLLLFLICKSI